MLDETGIFDLVSTSLLFWEFLTFGILLILVARYVYPPIRYQIQKRQAEIEGAIVEAQKTREEARELLAEYRRQIEEARGEGRRILEDARKQADAQRERTKKEAREEGDRIVQVGGKAGPGRREVKAEGRIEVCTARRARMAQPAPSATRSKSSRPKPCRSRATIPSPPRPASDATAPASCAA